jgi:hypothetical protein
MLLQIKMVYLNKVFKFELVIVAVDVAKKQQLQTKLHS